MSQQSLSGKNQFALTDEQKLNWLRLYRSQNVGPVTFRDLISHFGTASAALDALPELARRGGRAAKIEVFPVESAQREFDKIKQIGAKLLTIGEFEFPKLLRQTDQCPPIISCLGNLGIFSKPSISIVGARNASIAGQRLTERFAKGFGDKGYVVVSGLARGIDTAAHRASLDGGTIAVFAGGLKVIAPEENERLASDIVASGGLWITEQPIDWQPRAQDFPKRNRIIAGLSSATLVVEAARRSGSLITARIANEIGRHVLAIPGSPLDPRSQGPNGLIREGATLVTSLDEALEALAPLDQHQMQYRAEESDVEEQPWQSDTIDEKPRLNEPDDAAREVVLGLMSHTPIDLDDVLHFSGLEPGIIQFVLLELDLAGKLERHPGNRISLLT